MVYTNVVNNGNYILVREVGNILKKVQYKPTLFFKSQEITKFTTLDRKFVKPITFDSIKEARNFIEKYKNVPGFQYYGNTKFQYCYIADNYPENIEYDISKINIAYIDIETASNPELGFAEPDNPFNPITAITIYLNGIYYAFGTKQFTGKLNSNAKYIYASSESDLLVKFLKLWITNYPDIISGWNTDGFDLPYLYNRIVKLLGENAAKTLSPWKQITKSYNHATKREIVSISGISSLDYLELYKKYMPAQESMKLDYISYIELGERKVDYSEYNTLNNLHDNNFNKFIEYNIHDVELVKQLEDKLQLISLTISTAYSAHVNFEDPYKQVCMWDSIIFNECKKRHIVIPQIEEREKEAKFTGAYVKDVVPGRYKYIASFDLNSLYPSLIRQYNISPETITNKYEDLTIDSLLHKEYNLTKYKLSNEGICASGYSFNNTEQGLLPSIVERMYNERKIYKKKMLEMQQKVENLIHDNASQEEIKEAKRLAAIYKLTQWSIKIQINSLYGASGSPYFRFYDLRIAESITLSGQLVIKWINKYINDYLNKLCKTSIDFACAGDTDSLYLCLDDVVNLVYKDNIPDDKLEVIKFLDKFCQEKLEPVIEKACQELADYTNAFQNTMVMKRECLADQGIWLAKKHYILNVYNSEGVQYDKPHMKLMGIEIIKSSTPEWVRTKLKDSLPIILNGTERELQDYIKICKKDFKQLQVEDIASPRGVNGLEKYSAKTTLYKAGTPIHVRGSLLYNNLIKKLNLKSKYEFIKEGEKIRFVYLKLPNSLQENVISFSSVLPKEFDLEKYIDYDLQFEKVFLKPLESILDAVQWESERQANLFDF